MTENQGERAGAGLPAGNPALLAACRVRAASANGAHGAAVRKTGPTARARGAALAVLCVSALIVNLDNTILNVALPTLVRDLNASAGDLQWIVDAYVMVFAGLLLTAGSVADKIGRKKTFLAGLAVFGAGSAWAAFSGSVGVLIAARAGMGIGGALLFPSTLAIISDMYPGQRERQRAISLWAGSTGFAVALGPIIGGLLLARFWWGSVFLVNVPIAVIGLIAAAFLVPDSRNADAPGPDIPGAILSTAGIALVLAAIIEGPTEGWSSTVVIAAGAAGIVVLGLFAIWERSSKNPMLRLGYFRNRAFGAAIPAATTVSFGMFGALFVLTQFLQFELGYGPLAAGVRILPAAAAVVVFAPLSAPGIRYLGTKLTMAAGLALTAAGLWLASGVTAGSGYADIVPAMVLIGAGAGLAMPASTGAVLGSVPAANSGIASATNTTALQVGGALGVAVVGSLLSTRYQDNIGAALAGEHVPAPVLATIGASLGGALGVAAKIPGTAGQLLAHLARTAFTSGMDLGLLAASGVAIAGLLIAVTWLPRRPARQPGAPQSPAGRPEDQKTLPGTGRG